MCGCGVAGVRAACLALRSGLRLGFEAAEAAVNEEGEERDERGAENACGPGEAERAPEVCREQGGAEPDEQCAVQAADDGDGEGAVCEVFERHGDEEQGEPAARLGEACGADERDGAIAHVGEGMSRVCAAGAVRAIGLTAARSVGVRSDDGGFCVGSGEQPVLHGCELCDIEHEAGGTVVVDGDALEGSAVVGVADVERLDDDLLVAEDSIYGEGAVFFAGLHDDGEVGFLVIVHAEQPARLEDRYDAVSHPDDRPAVDGVCVVIEPDDFDDVREWHREGFVAERDEHGTDDGALYGDVQDESGVPGFGADLDGGADVCESSADAAEWAVLEPVMQEQREEFRAVHFVEVESGGHAFAGGGVCPDGVFVEAAAVVVDDDDGMAAHILGAEADFPGLGLAGFCALLCGFEECVAYEAEDLRERFCEVIEDEFVDLGFGASGVEGDGLVVEPGDISDDALVAVKELADGLHARVGESCLQACDES